MSEIVGRKRTVRRERSCPQCGAAGAVRIVYGLPSPDLFEASDRGDVSLGGCVPVDLAPTRECPSCAFTW